MDSLPIEARQRAENSMLVRTSSKRRFGSLPCLPKLIALEHTLTVYRNFSCITIRSTVTVCRPKFAGHLQCFHTYHHIKADAALRRELVLLLHRQPLLVSQRAALLSKEFPLGILG